MLSCAAHTQLVLGGIVDEDIGIQLLLDVITEVTRADLASHPYLTVVLNFARHCGEDVAGILPRKQRMLLTQYGIQPPTSEVCVCLSICLSVCLSER